MIAKIAWRNVWRSRTRSLVVIGAVVIGIWALTFLLGFVRGLVNSYITKGIENETSHVQFHHPNYNDDKSIQYFMANSNEIMESLQNDPLVMDASSRILLNGMLSSSKTKQGLILKGIDTDKERKISRLDLKLKEGTFFETKTKNPILISSDIAERMNVKLRSKLVFTFQDINGEISSAAFRVVGIYSLGNMKLDQFYGFARKEDLQRLSGLVDGAAHEIAVILNDFENTVDTYPASMQGKFPTALIQNYKELSPDLELFNSQIQLNLIIMTTIVMLALIFGIINTMLMAVLERLKELGMLMAIGLNKTKIFFMIVYETFFVTIVGAPIGLFLGYLTVNYLNRTGIDLSAWSKGLSVVGMTDLVRPFLPWSAYLSIAFAIALTALLASIYPARKAIKLKPVEAMRKI